MWANETEQHSPPLQPPKVSGLLSRNLAGKCCCNCHKYFSLSKFIFVCLILIIFPCVHAFLALLTNLASRKLAETAALPLIFLACHIIIFTILNCQKAVQIIIFINNVTTISFENVQYFSITIFIIVGNMREVLLHK